MNKTDAAKFLNIGVRTLERYTSAGNVTATRKKGKNGGTFLDYETEELERFQLWLHQQQEPSPPLRRHESDDDTEGENALMLATPPHLATLGGEVANSSNGAALVRFIAATVRELDKEKNEAQRGASAPELRDKLFLTIPEAAQLAGVGKSAIESAIKAGQITAHAGLGRGRRVRRLDLERWSETL